MITIDTISPEMGETYDRYYDRVRQAKSLAAMLDQPEPEVEPWHWREPRKSRDRTPAEHLEWLAKGAVSSDRQLAEESQRQLRALVGRSAARKFEAAASSGQAREGALSYVAAKRKALIPTGRFDQWARGVAQPVNSDGPVMSMTMPSSVPDSGIATAPGATRQDWAARGRYQHQRDSTGPWAGHSDVLQAAADRVANSVLQDPQFSQQRNRGSDFTAEPVSPLGKAVSEFPSQIPLLERVAAGGGPYAQRAAELLGRTSSSQAERTLDWIPKVVTDSRKDELKAARKRTNAAVLEPLNALAKSVRRARTAASRRRLKSDRKLLKLREKALRIA